MEAQFLCPTGSLCLQAIDKKFCSHADKQCGSINYAMVRITNTEGASDGAPWTTNTPPLYTVNVGGNCYVSFKRDDCRDGDGLGLLVHELAHVWQGQHGVPFILPGKPNATTKLAATKKGACAEARTAPREAPVTRPKMAQRRFCRYPACRKGVGGRLP